MKPILIVMAMVFLGLPLFAGEPESVSKQDLINSYRAFRQGALNFMEGMTAMYESASMPSTKAGKSGEDLVAERDRNYRLARPHLDRSIKLNPFYAPAYEMRAVILRETEKDFDAAIRDLSRAIDLDPEFDSALAARGEMLVRQGKLKEARKDLAALERRDSPRATGLRAAIKGSEPAGADQPAAVPELTSEGEDGAKQEKEGRPHSGESGS